MWMYLWIFALQLSEAGGRQLKFHGPILQWHEDPMTTVSFSWVEEIAADVMPNPVWRKGASGFGYGDGDDATVLDDMKGASTRLYLAKEFQVGSVPRNADLQLGVQYDDAFIAYINGWEVARSGNIRGYHVGADVTSNHESEREEVFTLTDTGRFLKSGRNFISIEGHNVRARSSDFTLEPRLIMNGRELVRPGDEWHYLAGADPSIRWYLEMPSRSKLPELAMEEGSEWELLVRRRGSGDRYKSIRPKDSNFGDSDHLVHQAKVTGLFPDTSYEYALVAGKQRVKTGWFRTAPAFLTKPMRFIVGGDMGTGGAIPMCRAVGREDPLFVAVGGDLAYANGRDQGLWFEWLDNWSDLVVAPDGRSIPIIAAIGNHETRSFSGLKKYEIWKGLKYLSAKKSKAPLFFSLFDLPGGDSKYAVDFGDYMAFVVLDSGNTQTESSQRAWLDAQLKARVGMKHLYAIYHRPAWGTGIKENDREVQAEWCPLFEEYQVDCVFENDHHVYKRSFPLTAGRRDERRGIYYIGDGAWGATVRPITDRMLDRSGARYYLAEWKAVHHVVRVTLQPGGARKYEAINSDRVVFDSLSDSRRRRTGMVPQGSLFPMTKPR